MSGRAVLIVLVVLALLAGAGAGVYFFVLRPKAGPLPEEALVLPGEATLVVGLDVKHFVSALRRLASGDTAGLPLPKEAQQELTKLKEPLETGLKEVEAKTGVKLDQDVDKVVAALWDFTGKEPKGAVVVTGRFDPAKLVQAVEAAVKESGSEVTSKDHQGTKVYTLGPTAGGVLAVLNDRTVLLGDAAAVEGAITSHAQGKRPLESNAGLMGLIRGLKPGSTFWMAAGEGFMTAMTQQMRGAAPFPLPKSFTMAEHPDAGLEVVAQMADATSAKSMADLTQGGLAALRMQASQEAGLKDLPPIDVKAEGSQVRLTARTPGGTAGIGGAGIVAAIAIPSLLRARVSANESAAIGDIRTVISAEAAYASVTGGSYGDMPCMSEPTTCMPDYPSNAPTFLDATLSSLADKNGYKRGFFPGMPGPRPRTFVSYAYTAVPLTPGQTGVRSFCGDASGRICSNADGSPFEVIGGRCPTSCMDLQ